MCVLDSQQVQGMAIFGWTVMWLAVRLVCSLALPAELAATGGQCFCWSHPSLLCRERPSPAPAAAGEHSRREARHTIKLHGNTGPHAEYPVLVDQGPMFVVWHVASKLEH